MMAGILLPIALVGTKEFPKYRPVLAEYTPMLY
jgi:hypothetical protein